MVRARKNRKYDMVIIDPSHVATINHFTNKGIDVTPANNSSLQVRSKEKTNANLNQQKDIMGIDLLKYGFDIKKILIHPDCINLINQIESNEFEYNEDTGKIKIKKINDDVLDVLRYVVNTALGGTQYWINEGGETDGEEVNALQQILGNESTKDGEWNLDRASQKHKGNSMPLEGTQSLEGPMNEQIGMTIPTFLHSSGNYDRAELVSQALAYAFLSDEEREQAEQNKAKAIKSQSFFDAVNNPYQALGSGTMDLSFNGLGLKQNRTISWQVNKLDSIMRDVPYFDKASSWKATRALLNGIDLNSIDKKTEELSIVKRDINSLFGPLHSVIKWGDYYGGSAGLIVCDDTQSEQDYMKPLIISKMSKGSFKGVKPLSRLYQIQPDLSSFLVTKVGEEYGIYSADEIGQPLYYMVNLSGEMEAKSHYFKVHRSRLLLYSSVELTWVEKRIEMYFGPSLLERAYSDFARYESMLAQVNKLAQRSNIPVLNIQNLPQASLNGQRFAEFVTARIKGINFGASSGNMIVLGDKDKEVFDYKTASFQQIPEILTHYQRNLAGTLEAPTSELFNVESEDDANRHLPKVKEIQERVIRVWYNKLIPLIYKNRFNKNIKDYGFKFKSLEMTTDKEKAEMLKMVVEMLNTLYQDNVADVESIHHMLIASQDNVSDMFNEITEKYREHVKNKAQDGEPLNKMAVDIELATALNHLQGQGEDGTNLSHKVESAQEGKKTGGDPKATKKPTIKIPISKE